MKRINNFFGIIFVSITIFFMKCNTIMAISSLNIVASQTSTTVGNSVIITVKSSDVAGVYKLTSSNGAVLSGGTNRDKIASYGQSSTWTFKANSAGTATITVSPIDMATVNEEEFTKSSSVTVTVKNKQVIVLSSDSSLSSLGVENATLSPEFTSGNKEYSVSLEPDITSINVLATTNHGGASVSGAGTREVTDGDNRIEIVVTAENGTTSTYVINANVKEYDPIEVKVKDQSYTVVRKKASLTPPNNYQETTIKINDTDVPAFHSDITGYTLVALKDNEGNQNYYIYENNEYSLYKEYNFHGIILYPEELKGKDIPNNYKKTIISYNDSEIVAYKIKKSSKYALIYGMNVETGIQNIYMYDAKEDTIQIYNQEEIETINEQTNMLMKISIGLGTLSIVLIGIIIGILIKNKKNHKKKIEKEEN